ncbi:MAG TPA: hypothetical protein VGI20_10960 [Rhizomicrobium sp.]|jgi:phage gpG-like protein
MIEARVDAARVATRLLALPREMRGGVRGTMQAQMLELLAIMRAKLSGDVLNARSGNLRASIKAEFDVDNGALTARSASDGSVPYARIQEYGGRIGIPELRPVDARALAFAYGGRMVFAKRTAAHVVTIPERSYLRSSLKEFAGSFVDAIRRIASRVCA